MWSEVNDNLHSFAALLKLINKPRNRTCVDRRELPVIELVVIALAICINILLVFQFSEWSFRTISPWKHNLYLLLDQVNSKHPYSALDICFVLLLTLREGWGYWIGWIFGKIPNGLPPLPPPSFLENYIAIFYDRYGCIYARRYAYMQKTCDVAEKAILAKKKFAEKVRKSRQNVNRDKSA